MFQGTLLQETEASMSRLSKGREIEEPAINLTPLIDVVFVILIMFILVAPILELDRVDLANAGLSSDQTTEVHETSPIAIHVSKNNGIAFNNKRVSIAQLSPLLKEARKKYPRAKPQLFHDRQAHFGTYQEVKNAVEAAGFSTMDIILKPSK